MTDVPNQPEVTLQVPQASPQVELPRLNRPISHQASSEVVLQKDPATDANQPQALLSPPKADQQPSLQAPALFPRQPNSGLSTLTLSYEGAESSGMKSSSVTNPGSSNGEERKEEIGSSPQDGQDEEDDDFKPKLPILRLKKLAGDNNGDNMTFEKQDTSKNDSYCWVCHDGGDVLCCDKCPRVFHVQCSGLTKAPEGEEDWYCPVCKNIARKTKRSRPNNLKDLLMLAVKRMMFPGTEIFQKDVPDDIMGHYREYIFFPMHLGKIKNKVEHCRYQSTRAFLHDSEWILHNCIIYNGAKHALTKIAKGIVKVCKEDMREIELCPTCYSLSVRQPDDWFCIPCNPPHRVVLAKVRGYPLWPAKLISETSDKCDVRFFGQHDRSLVPKSSIQELSGPPPTPTSKTQYWNIAMYELKKYRENINDIFEKMGGAKSSSVPTIERVGKPFKEARPLKGKEPKTGLRPVPIQHNHMEYQSQDESPDPVNNHHLPVSNYVPFSPQLVEVSVNLSDNEDGSMHGNSATLMQSTESTGMSEPSSPGSEPELQIDLDGSAGGRVGGKAMRDRQSPLKTRVAPPANHSLLSAVKRRTPQPPTALDLSTSISQPPGSSAVETPRGSKRRKGKPGEALSALLTSLTKRNLEAAGCDVAANAGALSFAAPVQSSTPVSGQGLIQEAVEVDGGDENGEVNLDSKFSTIYHDHSKTAIAVVDPDPKRARKKRNRIDQPPPPPKKIQKTQKNTSQASNAHTHQDANPPSPSKHIAHMVAQQIAQLQGSAETKSALVKASGNSTSASALATMSSLSLPAVLPLSSQVPTPHKQAHSAHSGKKRVRSTKSSSLSVASHSVLLSQPSPSVHLPTTLSSSTPALSQEATGVRGGSAAPRLEESPEFAEGSGLLADTIRKVDRSFRARLNQIAGSSDDMGYQYFTEKVMTSIKTVLIEMLSMFEVKGKMGAKQLKDSLHTAWPVPDSRSALDQLRRELHAEMHQSLAVVRAAAELERQQVVSEVRRQAEAEREIAVSETKKKKWCSYCWKEAQYNCCWNANYCNEVCQQAHWPEHMKDCMQIQQQVPPRTPAPMENAGTPTPSKLPLTGMGQEQQGFVFASPSRAQSINQNGNSSVSLSSSSSTLPSPHVHLQHHHRSSATHEHVGSAPFMAVADMHDQGGSLNPTTMEQSVAHIEQIPNENIMLNSANPASPPTHIRSILLNQQSNKGPVITGTAPLQMNPSPILGHPTLTSHMEDGNPALATADTSTLASNSMGSDHSSNSGSLVNITALQPTPMSPATPPSDNPTSVPNPHSFTSWPYQHPVIISDNYHTQSLSLLPAMQVGPPSTQGQAYFKPFGT